jgi:hypothetical protein
MMVGSTPLLWLLALGLGCLLGADAQHAPSLLSNCSYSYGTELFPESQTERVGPASVLGLSPLPNGTASLKLINVGFGTTGTRFLFKNASNSGRFQSGCHYEWCFGGTGCESLARHYHEMSLCVQHRPPEQHCKTEPWLAELRRLLTHCFSRNVDGGEGGGLELFMDTPASYIFSEVLNLVPKVTVQHSLRDPFDWALRRVQEYDLDVMCAPDRMPPQHELGGGALHILPCMLGSEFVYDNLITVGEYVGVPDKYQVIAEYVKTKNSDVFTQSQLRRLLEVGHWVAVFNQYVLRHSHPKRYAPVCVWDS